MARGKRTKTGKQEIFEEICDQIGLPFVQTWKSKGSTITATGFEAVLCKIAERTGIPPAHLEEHEKLTWSLLHKSLDGMILALEVINKPTVSYRMEAFLFLALNAWELLLKARLVSTNQQTESIYSKDNPDRTINFQYALKEVFPQEKDPIRMNLVRIEDLRNHAVHSFISSVPREANLLFQAAILNYEAKVKEWFERSLRERLPQGMMFLVADFENDHFGSASPILGKNLQPESLRYVAEWQRAVKSDFESLDESDRSRYTVLIKFNLAVINNPSKSDVLATFASEAPDQAVGLKYVRPIDRWPHSYDEVWKAVKSTLPTIKKTEFVSLMKELEIKGNECYSGYNFRTKHQEDESIRTGNLPKGLTVIYNDKAIHKIIKEFQERHTTDASITSKEDNTAGPVNQMKNVNFQPSQ